MPFAPHEIEKKKFVVTMRGYRTDEVDAFLRAVAADYRFLSERLDRIVNSAREEAEREAAEIRAAAAADAAEIREAAEAEAEGCFAEIARQMKELYRLKAAVTVRMHALEHTVVEARETLAHVGELYPNDHAVNGFHRAA